jgi:hypothetical protein
MPKRLRVAGSGTALGMVLVVEDISVRVAVPEASAEAVISATRSRELTPLKVVLALPAPKSAVRLDLLLSPSNTLAVPVAPAEGVKVASKSVNETPAGAVTVKPNASLVVVPAKRLRGMERVNPDPELSGESPSFAESEVERDVVKLLKAFPLASVHILAPGFRNELRLPVQGVAHPTAEIRRKVRVPKISFFIRTCSFLRTQIADCKGVSLLPPSPCRARGYRTPL